MSESERERGPLDALAREVGAGAARGDSREAVFRSLCGAVAERYDLAWVGTVEDGRIVVQESDGDDRSYPASHPIDGSDDPWRSVLDGGGTALVAFGEGERAPWADEAAERGFRSGLFAPIEGRDRVHGVLAAYDDDPGAFDGDERTAATFLEVAGTVGHALDRFVDGEGNRDDTARRFERVVRDLPDPVDLKDPKGRYRVVNDRFAVLLGGGADPEELAGTTDEDLFDPEHAATVRARDRRVMESGAVETTEERLAVDGRELVFETTRIPTYADGTVDGVATVRHESTDRVRRVEELERKNDRLETFASVVSHDLRNPLDIAEGYVGKARETGDPADFEEIETSIRRAKTLIDELLTLARADRQIDDTDEVDLGAVAEAAWGTVDTDGATLEREGGRTLTADEGQLQRLLENLFRNSVEHATDGVTVRVGTTDRGFFVADDGAGIPEDRHDRAFEPGYTTDDDGTGLGLAIVGRIAEAHGWSVSLSDAVDGGVRVDVDVTDGE